jgi:hypothetical protein
MSLVCACCIFPRNEPPHLDSALYSEPPDDLILACQLQ